MATGLEKMLQQILEEANAIAKEKTDAAKAEAESIMAEAQKAASAVESENEAKIAALEHSSNEKANSSAQLKRRQVFLAMRQEIITDILNQAQQKLISMKTEEYFAYIEKMLKKYAQAKSGEICFNAKDLKRMPAEFETVIAQAAKQNGGELTLSRQPVSITGGFILTYGGIEENCSVEAMFHTQKEMLADEINKFMFDNKKDAKQAVSSH